MTTSSGVLGLVMARDEWPLLGVSVTHALVTHVDHVLVLDHASEDGTAAGLEALGRRFPGRLTVLRSPDGAYHQEAATSLLLEVAHASRYDWVHVFDADELLLSPPDRSMADVLADVDPDVDVVRYDIQNWVAPSDFDDTDLASYARLRHRSVPEPSLATARYPSDVQGPVEDGLLSFFDLPFPSKVIIRGDRVRWLSAGAHLVRWPEVVRETRLAPGALRCAHLPFLSQRRLALKVAQGRALEASGLPPEHGWQNRMLHRMAEAGTLADFWQRHSVPEQGVDDRDGGPRLVEDGALALALAPTLSLLTDRTATDTAAAAAVSATQSVPTAAAVRSIRTAQLGWEAVVADLGRVIGDQQRLRALVETLTAERDALAKESSRRRVRLRRMRAEREALRAQRDELAARVEELSASRVDRARRTIGRRRLRP